jgi:hypothetical protein
MAGSEVGEGDPMASLGTSREATTEETAVMDEAGDGKDSKRGDERKLTPTQPHCMIQRDLKYDAGCGQHAITDSTGRNRNSCKELKLISMETNHSGVFIT